MRVMTVFIVSLFNETYGFQENMGLDTFIRSGV